LPRWFETRLSGPGASRPEGAVAPIDKPRELVRVGLPRVLNVWSTHQFWIGFLTALGFDARRIEFSSDTSEEQGREFGKGRGTVDCCYPVKSISGHYGELLAREKRPIDLLLSPMMQTIPSFLGGQVQASLACPRVMAAPENIKAGFLKGGDAFAAHGVRYVAPLVTLDEPDLAARQLHAGLKDVIADLSTAEVQRAVQVGLAELETFNRRLRRASRDILERCARENTPALLVLARPYHMDPGIGHEIEVDLQGHGVPVLWSQYLPIDDDLMDWMYGADVRAGTIRSPLDLSDVWPSSYSANTNEILWGAKFAARMPWIACAVRLSSYECGMDQPTYTPVQRIVESSGTLFFSFQDLDSTKPAGSVKIRVETIAMYLRTRASAIIDNKRAAAPPGCPLA
jgi:predicted nucleotide-binding protein (sugar kinase/HSP70/actin superfamily)